MGIERYRPVELVLESAVWSIISCEGEPSSETIELNVMSESPVADRRGGVASAFSSSSESSITLRFVIFAVHKVITTMSLLP